MAKSTAMWVNFGRERTCLSLLAKNASILLLGLARIPRTAAGCPRPAVQILFRPPCKYKKHLLGVFYMVGERGFEPPRPKPHAPKACVSTNSTTRPWILCIIANVLLIATVERRASLGYILFYIKIKKVLHFGHFTVERQRRVSVSFVIHHNNSINGRRRLPTWV